MNKIISVGILVFHDVELLDFCGPYEVLSIVRINEEMRLREISPFNQFLITETDKVIKTKGGMKVEADYTFGNHPPIDVLIIPGGFGVRKQIDNQKLTEWITCEAKKVELITSVCTGSILLGKAGVLNGRRATTHWRSIDWMKQLFPDISVKSKTRVVQDGNIITSAGISAGIDMALKVIEYYFGEAIARTTAKHMEYPILGRKRPLDSA